MQRINRSGPVAVKCTFALFFLFFALQCTAQEADNRYPITIANGFNGSHYAAEREYFLHVSKDL